MTRVTGDPTRVNHLIKEYWLHEWNQAMINRVHRASHLSEPVMGFVHHLEKGRHQ
jgi:hypothetical protein